MVSDERAAATPLQVFDAPADHICVTTISRSPDTVARTSRAVGRLVTPGNEAVCPRCDVAVRFAAKAHLRQVIANVYTEGRWDRVEHYHEDCYSAAGRPYGDYDG